MRKIINALSVIILLITFVLVILLFVTKVSGATPEVFGYQILRISSSSMEPELMTGDIILSVRIDDASSVEVGDIVTYNGEVGDYAGKLITHQVITAPYEEDGTYYLQTQGCANDYPDPEISESQLVGTMVCRLGTLSAVYSFFITPWGLIVVLGFLAVLFMNEIFALVQLVKENDDEKDKLEATFADSCEDEEARSSQINKD
ncbi:MAG: signal peptidase I [Clostridiales bacterium]|nr:signal peptidase I [Clostridiales bacterium]